MKEVWIKLDTSASPSTGGTGTLNDPFRVPVLDDEELGKIFADPAKVPRNTWVHIGPGQFLMGGDPASPVIRPRAGCRVSGAGVGITVIKLNDACWPGNPDTGTVIFESEKTAPSAGFHNVYEDMTVDCNYAAQHSSLDAINGVIGASGHTNLIQNIEVVGMGSRQAESFGVGVANFDNPSEDISFFEIRNVTVHKLWPGTSGGMSCICPAGNNHWSGVVDGCLVDASAVTSPTGQVAGLAIAGSPHGLVITNNTAVGCFRGFHVDTPGNVLTPPSVREARSVVIKHNRLYDCRAGIAIGGVGKYPDNVYRNFDAYFAAFLIEGNSIEMRRSSTNGIELWQEAVSCQVRNNTILSHQPPGSPPPVHVGISIMHGSKGHIIEDNRFGPRHANFYMTMPALYSDEPPCRENSFSNNTWIEDYRANASGIHRVRGSSTVPQSELWGLELGTAQADNNPSFSLWSSRLNGTDHYEYISAGRANGSYVNGHNLVLDPSGNSGVWVGGNGTGTLSVGGNLFVHKTLALWPDTKLVIMEGGGRMGVKTLSGGLATISTSQVTAYSRIFLSIQAGGPNSGVMYVKSRNPGTSFEIASTNTSDTSQVAWLLIDPGF